MGDRNLADVLWNRYRAWADVTVSNCTTGKNREQMRDKAYQWIVRNIAIWIDQIELETDFEKRTQMINRLLNGPLPEPGSVDFSQIEDALVGPKEVSTINEIHPNLAAKRSVLDAPPDTDQKIPLSPFGYGTGWSEFCL